MWLLGIFGAVLISAALFTTPRIYREARQRLTRLNRARPLTVGALEEIARALGPGVLLEDCELRGVASAAAPLRARLSGAECVYYSSLVAGPTDLNMPSGGRRRLKGDAPLILEERAIGFTLSDDTGGIPIRVEGAEWRGERLIDESGPGCATAIEDPALRVASGCHERAVLLGREVYVLGEARSDGGLSLGRPAGGALIISALPKEELIAEQRSTLWLCRILGPLQAVIGAALLWLWLR